MLEKVCGSKRVAAMLALNRYHTRGEPEEFIIHRWQSMKATPTERTFLLPKFKKDRLKNKLDWSKPHTGLDIKLLWWEQNRWMGFTHLLDVDELIVKTWMSWQVMDILYKTETNTHRDGHRRYCKYQNNFHFRFSFPWKILPPAYVFWGKVIISIVSVSLFVWMGSQMTTTHNTIGQPHESVQTC